MTRPTCFVAWLIALLIAAPAQSAVLAEAPCRELSVAKANFAVCQFDPRREDIRLYWKGADGKPYGGLAALAGALKAQGRALRFAMNGGIFEENLTPLGLYIEDGHTLRKLNLRAGASNFYLKPNGVFYVGAGVAGIVETGRFAIAPPPAHYATQSGPMMLVEGRINGNIEPTGTSVKIRNGVGVRADGQVIFAISDSAVTFHDFALLFRDHLDCPDALYLDGSVSQLYAQNLNRADALAPLGPIIGVSSPAP